MRGGDLEEREVDGVGVGVVVVGEGRERRAQEKVLDFDGGEKTCWVE